jgi:hypothetical protein
MALTYVGAFGSQLVTEKRSVQVTTDNVAVYECKISITIGSEVVEFSQLPDIGTSDTFTFEINTILRNYLKTKLLPLVDVSVNSENTLIYALDFYGVDVNGDNVSGETVSGGTVPCYNISQDELAPLTLGNYVCSGTGNDTRLLLTDFQGTRKILNNSFITLSCLQTTILQSWVIVSTDDDLNVITTNQFSPVGTGLSTTRYGSSLVFQVFGGGTKWFVFIADTPIGSGFTQTYRSKIYSFDVVSTPCNYLELYWVNQFGVMEHWLFQSNYQDSVSIDKKTFLKNRPVNPDALDRGQDIYSVESVRRFTIWSEYESMETIKFLNSIALSPQVAIKVNDVLVPVIVENQSVDNYNYHQPINRITFNVVFANKRINVV